MIDELPSENKEHKIKPISVRMKQPTPDEIRAARERAGMSQAQAAALISTAKKAGYKTWAGYETVEGKNARTIPLPVWELFLLLTEQHPTLLLANRTVTT